MRAHILPVLAVLALSAGAVQAQTAKPEAPAKAKAPPTPEAQFLKRYPKGTFCSGVPCYVDIVVATGCAKTVPTVAMARGVTGDVIWRFDPKSVGKVAFAANGIKPVDPKKWRKEFDNERPGAAEYTWHDINPKGKNREKGEQRKHSYGVAITQDGKPCKVDPIIINDY